MKASTSCRLAAAWLMASLIPCVQGAEAFTAADLQRLLQASPKAAVAYQEVRESPWLSAPVTARGSMHSSASALEKRVESPRKETWRLLDDRLEWQGEGGANKQVLFSQAPALGVLSRVMRAVVAGDLATLQRDFDVRVAGDAALWTVSLTPRDLEVKRRLASVELQGTRGQLQVIILAERQDEKTTIRLQP